MINRQRQGPILPREMFRGKCVPWDAWFAQWQDEYQYLLRQYGYDKFQKVYDYFFRLLSEMKFGQWINVAKACADTTRLPEYHVDPDKLPIFHLVLEMIYQGDLLSSYTYDTDKGFIYVDTPDKQLLQRLDMFFPDGDHYILNDQYRRWLADTAASVPEVSPSVYDDYDAYDGD